MASKEVAVEVKGITKSFNIPLENSSSIKQKIINVAKHRKGYRKFTSLKNIDFTINKGEFFGIVGRNGSGKSTLLKIIANIYSPDKGSVHTYGTLVPFIELGVGFNPELSGKENVYLNGALLGFSRKEMVAMYHDIVNFAELGDFMEERLKNYSSGMQVRLAFSIAIRAKSDILLLDEILAVGDEAFQRKCIDYFYSIKKSGQTVILVTHDMTNVEKFCDRALVLDNGKMLGIYKPAEAKIIYEQLNRNSIQSSNNELRVEKRWGNKEVLIDSIEINGSKKESIDLVQGQPFTVELKLSSKVKKPVILGLAIYDEAGLVLSGPNSQGESFSSYDTVEYSVPINPITPGMYKLRAAVYADDHRTVYDHIEDAVEINITSTGQSVYGKLNLFGSWTKG
jgi:ABC-2 type transport system ATP-binding protein